MCALSRAKGEMAILHRMVQRLNTDTVLAEDTEEPIVPSLTQDCMLAQQQLDDLLALNRGAASELLRHEEELIDGLSQFDAMLSASGNAAAGSSELLLGLRRLEDEVARKVTETTLSEQVLPAARAPPTLSPML